MLIPMVIIMASVMIGIVLSLFFPSADQETAFENTDWSADSSETQEDAVPDNSSVIMDPASVNDGFVRIESGSFLMGSPESENWLALHGLAHN